MPHELAVGLRVCVGRVRIVGRLRVAQHVVELLIGGDSVVEVSLHVITFTLVDELLVIVGGNLGDVSLTTVISTPGATSTIICRSPMCSTVA